MILHLTSTAVPSMRRFRDRGKYSMMITIGRSPTWTRSGCEGLWSYILRESFHQPLTLSDRKLVRTPSIQGNVETMKAIKAHFVAS